MKERPILFNGEMVKAILAGRKTQTCRTVKLSEHGQFMCSRTTSCEIKDGVGPWWHPHGGHPGEPLPKEMIEAACPHGKSGDRLWVRETWNADWCDKVIYRAGGGSAIAAGYSSEPKWKPSIHMPRWASRITLEITGVRVERIQDISEADAMAEGFHGPLTGTDWFGINQIGKPPSQCFRELWEGMTGDESWDENQWVWVIAFAMVKS